MRKLTRGRIEAFLKKFATTEPVLDVGAGSTEYIDVFPNRTRVDVDPKRSPDIVASVYSLPYADGTWGTIVCSEVFEHLERPCDAVEELHRVLRPGGRLVLTTRFLFPVHDAPGDFFRFTPYALESMFREKWDIESIEVENGPFGSVAVLLQRILFQTDVRGGKLVKAALHLLTLLLSKLDWLVKVQYGDIRRSTQVSVLMSSGVYMCAIRK